MDPQSSPPPGLHLERTRAVRTEKGEALVTIRAYLKVNNFLRLLYIARLMAMAEQPACS